MQPGRFIRARYNLDLFLTRKPKGKYKVPVFASIPDILQHLQYGNDYTPDPWNGNRDVMFHPTHTEKKLVTANRKMGMDCDDHAIYYCVALMKSALAKRVWCGCFQMKDNATGKRSGHAICIFLGLDDKMYWMDYALPNTFSAPFEWAQQSATIFNSKPIEAIIYDVTVSDNDNPVLGDYVKKKF